MFASLASNDEDIRKRIVESPGLMSDLLAAVEGECQGLQLAALRCLLSLSRSVQTLRTAMQVGGGGGVGGPGFSPSRRGIADWLWRWDTGKSRRGCRTGRTRYVSRV